MRRRTLLAAAIGLILTGNALATRLPTTRNRFLLEANGPSDFLTVVAVGMKADGDLKTQQVRASFRAIGNVVVVTYDPVHFDLAEIVAQLADYLDGISLNVWSRKKLLVFGASIGGQVGLKLIDVISEHWQQVPELSFIAVDVPADASDLALEMPARVAAVALWPGHFENFVQHLFTRDPVPDFPHDADSNDTVRMANNAASYRYPFSSVCDQVRALAFHRTPPAKKYVQVNAVVLRSAQDTEVQNSATQKMLDAFGLSSDRAITVPGTTHISFAEHPGRWRTAIDHALDLLGLAS
ncbi:MAG TPA: hypothetical protein VD907_01470 [Verrucomicrobiae bacterium]|nr:hypothetical protein [Verrucomicrobiae bacterium]